mgnify:FL=1
MPTACSPQDCTSCTSMIGGRSGLYKYLLKIRAVIPLPPVSVRFRFLSSAFLFLLIRPILFPPKILSHLSLFPAPLSVLRHAFLHFSSPLHRPFVLLHPCLSHSPYVLSFFHIIMYAHVCGCGSAASFASFASFIPTLYHKGN